MSLTFCQLSPSDSDFSGCKGPRVSGRNFLRLLHTNIPVECGTSIATASLMRIWMALLIAGIFDRSLFFNTPTVTRNDSLLGPLCSGGT